MDQNAWRAVCQPSDPAIVSLANPRTAEGHGRGGAAMAARKLCLIRAPAMLDAVRKTGVHLFAAEMKIGFAGMAHRPAADAIVKVKQTGLVRDFRAGPCGHKAARWCGRDRRLLIARALTQEATGANRHDPRLRRRGRSDYVSCSRCRSWRCACCCGRRGRARRRGGNRRRGGRCPNDGRPWLSRCRSTRCLWCSGPFRLVVRFDGGRACLEPKPMSLADYGVAADAAEFFGDLAGGRAAFPHLRQLFDPVVGPTHAFNVPSRPDDHPSGQ